ncbi:MAG: PAS domain S-box protein [Candidatus Aureabacteria bacterium]|nr:PAS domain S-box protein [Candidatus Auribacterota bacterium]
MTENHYSKSIKNISNPVKKKRISESEERFHSIFENSPISLWEEDFSELKKYFDKLKEEGIKNFRKYFDDHPEEIKKCVKKIKVENVNKATIEMFKAESKEAFLENLGEVFTKDSFNGFKEEIIALAEGKKSFEIETENKTLKGDTINVMIKLMIPSENKKSGKIIVSIVDITKIKKIEKKLCEERDKAKRYLDLSGVMFVAIDKNACVTMINKKGCEILGYKEKVIIGKNWFENFVPERIKEEIVQISKALLAGHIEPVEYFENPVLTSKGEERLIAWRNTILKDDKGNITGHISSGEDVTDKKRMEDELIKEKRLESVGLLAGGIAHDFNNLLTVVRGNNSLLRLYYPPDKEGCECISAIEEAVIAARSLSDQLLTFASGGEPIKGVASLKKIVENMVVFNLRGSKVSPEFSLEEELWSTNIDSGQIKQVVSNLVINAVNAMSRGGILRVNASNIIVDDNNRIGDLKNGKYVKVSFNDEGPGIADEIKSNIFTPFFTTKEMGRGLGLAICYSIIKKHKGFIFVDSSFGKGTTFSFYLPATSEILSSDVKGKKKLSNKLDINVLIMDDDINIMDLLGEFLKNRGARIEKALNGMEAVEKYFEAKRERTPFDAIILDLTVPGGMGGVETLNEIKRQDSSVKAFVMSGYSRDTVLSNYSDYGFIGEIKKPFELEDIDEMLQKV